MGVFNDSELAGRASVCGKVTWGRREGDKLLSNRLVGLDRSYALEDRQSLSICAAENGNQLMGPVPPLSLAIYLSRWKLFRSAMHVDN